MWQYYRDEPNDNLENSESFKSKIKITGKTPAAGNEKDVEIMVPLKELLELAMDLQDLHLKKFLDSTPSINKL